MVYDSIAISGFPGSGKSTLCRMLSEELGWDVRSVGDYLRARHQREGPEISFEEYYKKCTKEDLMKINIELAERVNRGGIIADTRIVYFLGENTLRFHDRACWCSGFKSRFGKVSG